MSESAHLSEAFRLMCMHEESRKRRMEQRANEETLEDRKGRDAGRCSQPSMRKAGLSKIEERHRFSSRRESHSNQDNKLVAMAFLRFFR